LETKRVRLHYVNAGTHWLPSLAVFGAGNVVEFYCVDSGDTAAGKLRQVDVELERTSNHSRLVSVVLTVEGSVMKKDVIVAANIDLVGC